MSKWSLITSRPDFEAISAKAIRAKKPTSVLAFVTEEERGEFAHIKLCFSATDAFSGLMRLDRMLSTICQEPGHFGIANGP